MCRMHWPPCQCTQKWIYVLWPKRRNFHSRRNFSETSRQIHLPRISSTEKKDIDTRLTKAWTAIDRLLIIWKSDLTDKMKRSFFQAAVVSILLYGCTTWTLTKRLKKLNCNYTRMLRAILNKSWRQHPTRHQLYGHLSLITKTIQVRQTRHPGHCWSSKDDGSPHMAKQKQDDQIEHAFSSYVRIRDVALKTSQRRWMIGRSGERGYGISVLATRHDDDDTAHWYIKGRFWIRNSRWWFLTTYQLIYGYLGRNVRKSLLYLRFRVAVSFFFFFFNTHPNLIRIILRQFGS